MVILDVLLIWMEPVESVPVLNDALYGRHDCCGHGKEHWSAYWNAVCSGRRVCLLLSLRLVHTPC
jgi:hypothetical protein